MENPKLRYGLEAILIQREGRPCLVLRDRLGYTDKTLVLNAAFAHILNLLDGDHSLRDIQADHFRRTGELLYTEHLEELVRVLDEHLFLENQRYIQHVAHIVARFRDDPVRRARNAGKSYPEDPEELNRLIRGFFDPQSGGPGWPDESPSQRERLCGLVAPHIDIRAGGVTFAHAYHAALCKNPPKTWIVLGTGHEPVEHGFAVTMKDFETPVRTVPCDRSVAEILVEEAPWDILEGEFNHFREHTVEFQAVFLACLQPDAAIVPLLCSFGWEEWSEDRDRIDRFCRVIRRCVFDSGRSVGVLASVDLAHVGPRYGDDFTPTQHTVREHLERDGVLLELLSRCDADAFMTEVFRDGNARKICGVAPLYVLSRVLEGRARGKTLHHAHTVVDPSGSFVTFAAMAFVSAEPAE